ncbi:MAG TPA: fumarylacetoacetate hydrolase family protein [Planctomycetota bacterium]|jgi:2-keto-4-pentenoate hydratase/2-oxohepta-3-ene-1,7-dioic acid hydratase in catechol pathway|nr:fumarylacetoacetate hydrolase family protein [Planctomycetota bacterium]
MKLLRVGEFRKEKPAVQLADGHVVDVSSKVRDFDSAFFEDGGLEKLKGIVKLDLPSIDLAGKRLGSPIARPYKVLGIGLNYADHAKESNMPIPPEPVVFTKASNTVVGPNDTVLIPRASKKTDWEVELGVVIGKTARYLADKDSALSYVAGYCISNDVSEREFQLERGGSWDKGKSAETFNPLGPWLVTTDEIPDPQVLGMSLDVNGVRRQTGNTKTMVFNVKHLVWYLSQFMVLEAGDVITTGTPPGVGLGQKPNPIYLKEGDVMELAIDGLGKQRQVCKQA